MILLGSQKQGDRGCPDHPLPFINRGGPDIFGPPYYGEN